MSFLLKNKFSYFLILVYFYSVSRISSHLKILTAFQNFHLILSQTFNCFLNFYLILPQISQLFFGKSYQFVSKTLSLSLSSLYKPNSATWKKRFFFLGIFFRGEDMGELEAIVRVWRIIAKGWHLIHTGRICWEFFFGVIKIMGELESNCESL